MEKLRIDPSELTLEQIDQATKLVEEGSCGQVTAMAFVFLKGQDKNTTLNDVRKLRVKDVEIVNAEDEAETSEDFLTESA